MPQLEIIDEIKSPDETPTPNLPAPKDSVRVAALMMLKNEEKRLHVTLESIRGFVDGFIMFDTGSTDKTIEIARKWCEDNSLPFHLTEGEFDNYTTSRNVLFNFADTIQGFDYLLSLDCNDELKGGPRFREECVKHLSSPEKVFMIRQTWLTGVSINKYLNARLTKTNHGWRYKGRVHEYLFPPPNTELNRPNLSEDVFLYQNRNEDDDKTLKRFKRDKMILLEDVERNNDSRDIFYLAQTLGCLHEYDDALKWYAKRVDILTGFWEERFHSYVRSADIHMVRKDQDMAIGCYFKAAMVDFRAEPLVALGKIYRDKHDFFTSYAFLSAAGKLGFPDKNILFINAEDYSYERWQYLAIVCFYVGRYTEGRQALERAMASGKMPVENKKNTETYQSVEGKSDTELFETEEPIEELVEIEKSFMSEATTLLHSNQLERAIVKYFQAFQVAGNIRPLLALAEICRNNQAHALAHVMTGLACSFKPPVKYTSSDHRLDYEYMRWHFFSIICIQMGDFIRARECCMKALKHGHNVPLDKKNLMTIMNFEKNARIESDKKLEEKLREKPEEDTKKSSLNQYKETRSRELMSQNPKLSLRQAQAKAQLEWKLKK